MASIESLVIGKKKKTAANQEKQEMIKQEMEQNMKINENVQLKVNEKRKLATILLTNIIRLDGLNEKQRWDWYECKFSGM